LRHHAARPPSVRRAAGRRDVVDRRRPAVQPAPGLRPLPAARCPPRHARAPAGGARRTARRCPGPAACRARAARHLHPIPRGTRDGSDRAGHLLARPPHRRGARRDRRRTAAGGTRSMSTIRVAIAGVGNCASSLVQGITYYRDADPSESVPGLMHVVLGGYHVRDVEFAAAFDVDASKVGIDLSKAIAAGQNNTIKFAQVGETGVIVSRGPTFDGLGKYYRQTIEESPAPPVDVTQ